MKYKMLIVLLFAGCHLVAQVAGYRTIVATDSGRRYKPGAHLGDRLYFRPVELDCWYPAKASGGLDTIRYGEFLQLFEHRANGFQDDTVYTGLAGQVSGYLCAGLGIKDTASLMRSATQSFRNAVPTPGRFPLLVYMCSYNGMCYENVRLFETLARHGYVVVSITSVGRYPGNMSMEPEDLREQVADGLFAIHLLQKDGGIDMARVGLIGYSWGGPAALLLAGMSPVAAVLSLDGSELHYYFGRDQGEDSDFTLLRPGLVQGAKQRFAYAYLESDGKQSERPADSIFNLLPVFPGPKKYLRFPGASHEDFSSLPYLGACIRRMDTSGLPDYVDFAVRWFDEYFKVRTRGR